MIRSFQALLKFIDWWLPWLHLVIQYRAWAWLYPNSRIRVLDLLSCLTLCFYWKNVKITFFWKQANCSVSFGNPEISMHCWSRTFSISFSIKSTTRLTGRSRSFSRQFRMIWWCRNFRSVALLWTTLSTEMCARESLCATNSATFSPRSKSPTIDISDSFFIL